MGEYKSCNSCGHFKNGKCIAGRTFLAYRYMLSCTDWKARTGTWIETKERKK